MLQAPLLNDVHTPQVLVQFGSRTVDATSVSVSRELSDSLPGSGTFTAATGTAQVTEGPDVAETVVTPWDAGTQWPPSPETATGVQFDVGAGLVPALTGGRVTGAQGGTGSREVSVDFADAYESFNKSISWDPLMADMPSLTEARQFRHVGLQSSWVTDRILRHCGWYATPPKSSGVFMSATLMGSTWPEVGEVKQSGRYTDVNLYPSWAHCPWGVCAQDVKAIYTPSRNVIFSDAGAEVTSTVPEGETGMYVKLVIGFGRQLTVQWSGSYVIMAAQTGPSSFTELVRIPRGTATTASCRFTCPASGRIQGEIRLDDGTTLAGIDYPFAAVYLDAVISEVHVLGPNQIGAVQCAVPSTPHEVVQSVPTAVLYTRGGGRNALVFLPTAESEDCAALLQQQCEAEAATFWIDETGVLRWWDLSRLEARGSVATLTGDDHIAETGFQWSHDASSVKSRVAVKWRTPAVERSYNHRVDLWQGSGMTLQSGETVEEWAACPDDEVWIMPDLAMKMGDAGSHDFNYGFGTWVAACLADTDLAAQGQGSFNCAVSQVTGSAYKVVYNWTGPDAAVLQTPSERKTSAIWMRRRNMNMPIIRGKAKIAHVEAVTYSTQSGPARAPEHTIDAGWWIQSESQAQYTADYAAARTTVQQPVLSSIALLPVPGLQLGDMVTVEDSLVTRLTVRGIVVRNDITVSIDGVAQSAAIRPVSVSSNGHSWQDWAAINRTQWSTWGTNSQNKIWQEWGNDPMAGEGD